MVDYKSRSRKLRRNQTDAEKKIWSYLRNRQINGIKFHRQYVIEPYICDFVARDIDVIVEIDGGQHNENKYDEVRDTYLKDKGYRVIRYWNNDVMNNIEGVIEDMTNKIETLTPALFLKGEGVLPTSKLERWKYSNLPTFVKGEYTDESLAIGYDGDDKFVMDDDVTIMPWAEQVYGDMDLWSGLDDVLSLVIAEDTSFNLSSDIAENVKATGHVNIVVKANANVTIYDHADVHGWALRSTTIIVEDGATVNHIRTGTGAGVATNLTQVSISGEATYNAYALNNYGAFTRDQIHARLIGEDAKCYLSGAKLLSDNNHCDTCILIEHEAPNCYSNQNYRNILDGQSRGVFQGKVHVHQVAQLTDGYQLCNSILLSDKAEMDTKPELEIYADDVKCSHGATTAQLDEDPLFYLQARGIPKSQAQSLLLEAFVGESLEAFEENKDIYGHLNAEIERTLSL